MPEQLSPELMSESLYAALRPALVNCDRTSVYPWGPVFRVDVLDEHGATVTAAVKRTWRDPIKIDGLTAWQRALHDAGVPVVTPLKLRDVASPIAVDEGYWTAYPWIEGRPWDGSIADTAAAGRLLGLMHRHSLPVTDERVPPLEWPTCAPESVQEDVDILRKVSAYEGADDPTLADRWEHDLRAFPATTLPAIRDADLPTGPMTLDHRATNLIYPTSRGSGTPLPTMIDFENAEVAPRLLDLAISVLLFGSEAPSNPGHLFDQESWVAYRDAYLAAAPALTATERELWPAALDYMRLEWGTWHLGEGAAWDLPHERGLLHDLLTIDPAARFPLD